MKTSMRVEVLVSLGIIAALQSATMAQPNEKGTSKKPIDAVKVSSDDSGGLVLSEKIPLRPDLAQLIDQEGGGDGSGLPSESAKKTRRPKAKALADSQDGGTEIPGLVAHVPPKKSEGVGSGGAAPAEKRQTQPVMFAAADGSGDEDAGLVPRKKSSWKPILSRHARKLPVAAGHVPDTGSVDGPSEVDGIPETIDMKGARLAYDVRGGLAAVENTLRIWADGRVVYAWSRKSVGGGSGSLEDRIPLTEVRMLKMLFEALEFESFPSEFHESGITADGVDFLVAAKLRQGLLKAVRSHTAALEDPRYTQIRILLEDLIAELQEKALLQVTERSGFGPDLTVRIYTLRASGRLDVESSTGLSLIESFQVDVDSPEMAEILESIDSFDFAGSPACLRQADDGDKIEMSVARRGISKTVCFSRQDDAPALSALQKIVLLLEAAARNH